MSQNIKFLASFVICFWLSAAYSQNLKVMTFNIRYDNPSDGKNSWNNRKGLVVRMLINKSPDIIGMQEVLEKQAVYLRSNLKGYDFVGAGRDDGKTGGEYSPAYYKKDLFKVMDWGTFWLSPAPDDTGSVGWDAALTRICTWVRFEGAENGNEFFFLNTHFDHIGLEARKKSAELIIGFMASHTGDLPVILTGDFNCTPVDEPYSVLTNPENGLKDACIAVRGSEGCDDDTFNGFGSSPEKERIDLILMNEKWDVKTYKMIEVKKGKKYISDHWPVMAEISGR